MKELSDILQSVGFLAGIVLLIGGGLALVQSGRIGTRSLDSSLIIMVLGTLALVCVGGIFWGMILTRRGTLDDTVVFEEGRILFLGPTRAVVSWGELGGYRDRSSDWIELVSVSEYMHRLLVPTRTEVDRVAVLELLDRRGLCRLD